MDNETSNINLLNRKLESEINNIDSTNNHKDNTFDLINFYEENIGKNKKVNPREYSYCYNIFEWLDYLYEIKDVVIDDKRQDLIHKTTVFWNNNFIKLSLDKSFNETNAFLHKSLLYNKSFNVIKIGKIFKKKIKRIIKVGKEHLVQYKKEKETKTKYKFNEINMIIEKKNQVDMNDSKIPWVEVNFVDQEEYATNIRILIKFKPSSTYNRNKTIYFSNKLELENFYKYIIIKKIENKYEMEGTDLKNPLLRIILYFRSNFFFLFLKLAIEYFIDEDNLENLKKRLSIIHEQLLKYKNKKLKKEVKIVEKPKTNVIIPEETKPAVVKPLNKFNPIKVNNMNSLFSKKKKRRISTLKEANLTSGYFTYESESNLMNKDKFIKKLNINFEEDKIYIRDYKFNHVIIDDQYINSNKTKRNKNNSNNSIDNGINKNNLHNNNNLKDRVIYKTDDIPEQDENENESEDYEIKKKEVKFNSKIQFNNEISNKKEYDYNSNKKNNFFKSNYENKSNKNVNKNLNNMSEFNPSHLNNNNNRDSINSTSNRDSILKNTVSKRFTIDGEHRNITFSKLNYKNSLIKNDNDDLVINNQLLGHKYFLNFQNKKYEITNKYKFELIDKFVYFLFPKSIIIGNKNTEFKQGIINVVIENNSSKMAYSKREFGNIIFIGDTVTSIDDLNKISFKVYLNDGEIYNDSIDLLSIIEVKNYENNFYIGFKHFGDTIILEISWFAIPKVLPCSFLIMKRSEIQKIETKFDQIVTSNYKFIKKLKIDTKIPVIRDKNYLKYLDNKFNFEELKNVNWFNYINKLKLFLENYDESVNNNCLLFYSDEFRINLYHSLYKVFYEKEYSFYDKYFDGNIEILNNIYLECKPYYTHNLNKNYILLKVVLKVYLMFQNNKYNKNKIVYSKHFVPIINKIVEINFDLTFNTILSLSFYIINFIFEIKNNNSENIFLSYDQNMLYFNFIIENLKNKYVILNDFNKFQINMNYFFKEFLITSFSNVLDCFNFIMYIDFKSTINYIYYNNKNKEDFKDLNELDSIGISISNIIDTLFLFVILKNRAHQIKNINTHLNYFNNLLEIFKYNNNSFENDLKEVLEIFLDIKKSSFYFDEFSNSYNILYKKIYLKNKNLNSLVKIIGEYYINEDIINKIIKEFINNEELKRNSKNMINNIKNGALKFKRDTNINAGINLENVNIIKERITKSVNNVISEEFNIISKYFLFYGINNDFVQFFINNDKKNKKIYIENLLLFTYTKFNNLITKNFHNKDDEDTKTLFNLISKNNNISIIKYVLILILLGIKETDKQYKMIVSFLKNFTKFWDYNEDKIYGKLVYYILKILNLLSPGFKFNPYLDNTIKIHSYENINSGIYILEYAYVETTESFIYINELVEKYYKLNSIVEKELCIIFCSSFCNELKNLLITKFGDEYYDFLNNYDIIINFKSSEEDILTKVSFDLIDDTNDIEIIQNKKILFEPENKKFNFLVDENNFKNNLLKNNGFFDFIYNKTVFKNKLNFSNFMKNKSELFIEKIFKINYVKNKFTEFCFNITINEELDNDFYNIECWNYESDEIIINKRYFYISLDFAVILLPFNIWKKLIFSKIIEQLDNEKEVYNCVLANLKKFKLQDNNKNDFKIDEPLIKIDNFIKFINGIENDFEINIIV